MRTHATAQMEIHASELIVSYGPTVGLSLPNLSLRGGIIGVLGKNGAGKSTFIKTILKLLTPLKGTLSVRDGNSEETSSTLLPSRDMAFSPETGAVFSDITVEQYIKFWCRLKYRDSSYYRNEGSRFIDILEISPLLRKRGRFLSKGERRRVQTAIGFLLKPRLFLFDEPFDGLDVQKTHQLVELIMVSHATTSFIISSHRMDVVERLSDNLIVLGNGVCLASGETQDVAKTLAGSSLILRFSHDSTPSVQIMAEIFPKEVITPLGNQMRLSGKNLTIAQVHSALQNTPFSHFDVSETSTPLSDAMTVHLRDT
jgi:ABC-2 type transport system ATP-binding protein